MAKIFPRQQSISSLSDSISYRTWVLKTRDASFLHTFKTLLTNDIIFLRYANLQISPFLSSGGFLFFSFFFFLKFYFHYFFKKTLLDNFFYYFLNVHFHLYTIFLKGIMYYFLFYVRET